MGRRGKRAPEKVSDALAQAQAVELARDGGTIRDIAAALGCSPSTAQKTLERGIQAMVLPDAAEWRKAHVTLLEGIYRDMRASRGDPQAASVAIKALERQAKLLGLDAATKVDLSKGFGAMSDGELLALKAAGGAQ